MNSITPEDRMRIALLHLLNSLEWRVVRPLVGAIEMEHLFMDARTAHSVRAEIATRRIAVVLGSIALTAGVWILAWSHHA